MRTEAINHRYVYDSALQTSHLVESVANSAVPSCPLQRLLRHVCVRAFVLCVDAEHHKCTQFYVRRPFGVGLLVAGVDVSLTFLPCVCLNGFECA